MRNHDVQSVHRAALEDRHQDLLARAGRIGSVGARDSHAGVDPTPNIASAELFKKTRREVIFISSENPVSRLRALR